MWMKQHIMDIMHKLMVRFAGSRDNRSSKNMMTYMALTIHFLTKDFKISFMIEVEQIKGKHSGELIQDHMEKAFDNMGSRRVNDLNDWGIPHFHYMGHCLHLIVDPLLVKIKEEYFPNDD
jgi:hypothetical protein